MCNLVDSNYVSIENHAYVTAYEIKNFLIHTSQLELKHLTTAYYVIQDIGFIMV